MRASPSVPLLVDFAIKLFLFSKASALVLVSMHSRSASYTTSAWNQPLRGPALPSHPSQLSSAALQNLVGPSVSLEKPRCSSVGGGGRLGAGAGAGGGRRRGEEDAGTRTPTDDWLQITRGTRGARGPALPFTNPLLAGGATFPGSPAARPSSSRLALRLSRPAQRAVDYFLLLSEIIVWKEWKEGVSATLSLTLHVRCVCVCVHVRVCVCK